MIDGKGNPERKATDVTAIKNRIQDKDTRTTLLSVLDASEELLTELVGEEILDDSTKDDILAGPTRTEVNKRVLKWLNDSDDALTFEKFLAKLRQHGQKHVANFLDGTKGELPLTTKARQNIQKIMIDLTKGIDPESGLLEALVSDEVISDTAYEEIKAEKIKSSQIKTLLNILLRGSDKAYEKFLEELMKYQPQAMKIIDKQEGEVTQPHVEILKATHDVFMRCTDINVLTIAVLRSEGVINGSMEDGLKTQQGEKKLTLMYNWLVQKPANTYRAFIRAMQENEQKHVANLLSKNSVGQQPMSKEKFQRLIDQRPHLIRGIFSKGIELASALISQQASEDTDFAISKTDYEDITQVENTSTIRNSVLIDAILRRTDFSYDSLGIALRQTRQEDLADLLIEGEVVGAHINTTHPDKEGDLSNAWNDRIVNPKMCEEDRDLQRYVNEFKNWRLPTVATDASGSIVVYTYCKTPEDMKTYMKLLNSGKLRTAFENILNHLLKKLEGENFRPLEAAVMLEEEDKKLVQKFTGLDGDEDDFKGLPFISSEICTYHGEPKNIYCFDCKMVICSTCVEKEHKYHKHSDVSRTPPDDLREQLQNDLALISRCTSNSLQLKETIENDRMRFIKAIEESEKAVMSRCEDLKQRVDRFREMLLQERATFKQQILHGMDARKRAIESYLAVFKDYEDYTKTVVGRGSPSDICNSFPRLHERATKLQQACEPITDRTVSTKSEEWINQTSERIGINPAAELTKVLIQGMTQTQPNISLHRPFLEACMDPCFGLVEELSLPKKDSRKIINERTPEKKNAKLLDYILKNEKHNELITALTKTNQTHIVNFLNSNGAYNTKFGGDWPLIVLREAQILDACRKYLVEHLRPEPLLEKLHDAQVISTKQKDSILGKIALHERNEALLAMLKRGSLDNYNKTVECLHLSNQSNIAQILRPFVAQSQVNVTVRVNDKETDELLNSLNQLIASRGIVLNESPSLPMAAFATAFQV